MVFSQAWVEELFHQVLERNLLGEAGYWGSPEEHSLPLITMLTGQYHDCVTTQIQRQYRGTRSSKATVYGYPHQCHGISGICINRYNLKSLYLHSACVMRLVLCLIDLSIRLAPMASLWLGPVLFEHPETTSCRKDPCFSWMDLGIVDFSHCIVIGCCFSLQTLMVWGAVQ